MLNDNNCKDIKNYLLNIIFYVLLYWVIVCRGFVYNIIGLINVNVKLY